MAQLLTSATSEGAGSTFSMDGSTDEYTLTIKKTGGSAQVALEVQMPDSSELVRDNREEEGLEFELPPHVDGLITIVNGNKKSVRGFVEHLNQNTTVWMELEPAA